MTRPRLPLLLSLSVFLLLIIARHGIEGASYVVAASNSSPEAKKRADVICTGTDDQKVLFESMRTGHWIKTEYDDNAYTYAFSSQSVEWLPGDYYLSGTLLISQSVDSILHAEGAIFHYLPATGDAIVITGSLRSRFYLGTIWTGSSGAALAFKDRPYSNPFMPNLMSVTHFQGLQHDPPSGTTGVGLWLSKHFCVNKVEGTDIRGFGMGVFVDDTGEGKVDTNWYWLSFIRGCGQDIVVQGQGVDSQQWFVNVDATLPNSVAIRTAALYERWQIIMGTMDRSPGTRSIILDPGAQWNWMEITPPLWNFDGYENNSGYPNNVFIQSPRNTPQRSKKNRNTKHNNATAPLEEYHLVVDLSPSDDGPEPHLHEEDVGVSVKAALQTLKKLYQDDLITEKDYEMKKQEILARL